MEQTPYGNSALWNVFNPKSIYNPMQKTSPSDIVSQQGGVSNWIQKGLGINANTMSENDLYGLNNQYERATTDLGNNWERQRVVDKNTGTDVATNDYYHAPTNVLNDYILPTATIFGAGLGFHSLMNGGLGSLFAGTEGLSGMDLAVDAALGTGNNVMTAGAGLGGGTAVAGGLGSMATNPALIESAVGTPGYGMSSAGMGGAASGGGAMDILKGLGKSLIGGQGGGISNLGNLASLFSNYKQYSNTGDLMDDIRSIYSPDGVYAKELEKQLARRDAAAGRNSQYGPRLAELMARLGDSQARSLSGLGGMMQTQQGGLNGMLGAGQRVLEGTGILDKLFSIFGD